MGRVLGISSAAGNACWRSAVATGEDLVGWQLHLQPAIAIAEVLARLCDADEVVEIELLTHVSQHLEWKVQQGGLVRRP